MGCQGNSGCFSTLKKKMVIYIVKLPNHALIFANERLFFLLLNETSSYPLKKEKSQILKFLSRDFKVSMSFSDSSKSNRAKFSRSRSAFVLFGMITIPRWSKLRSRIWAGERCIRSAIFNTSWLLRMSGRDRLKIRYTYMLL